MSFFTTDDGVKLHYETVGSGGTPVVYVHGFVGRGDSFLLLSDELQKTRKVVIFDHRGHGESETPDDGWTIERLAQDLKNLLDFLGLDKVIPVGYSMGTHVVYSYIRQFGIDRFEKVVLSVMSPKLVTDDTYKLGLGGNFPAQAALDYLILANKSVREYSLLNMTDDMTDEQKKLMLENADRVTREHKSSTVVRLLVAMFANDYWDVVSKITCPALVIAGEHDIYPQATQREVSRRIAGSRLRIIKGCSHYMMFEKPQEYFHELIDFIG